MFMREDLMVQQQVEKCMATYGRSYMFEPKLVDTPQNVFKPS